MTPNEAQALAVAPMNDDDVQQVQLDTSMLLEAAEALKIRTDADDVAAKELLAQVKTARKRVDDMRKRWTQPLNESLKRINGDFRKISDPIAEAERLLRDKVATYYTRKQEQAEKRTQRAIERAVERGEAPVLPASAQPQRVTHTDAGTVSFREVWSFEITDPAQVPDEYKVIDEKKIGAVVKAGVRSIPGVHIFAERKAVVR